MHELLAQRFPWGGREDTQTQDPDRWRRVLERRMRGM